MSVARATVRRRISGRVSASGSSVRVPRLLFPFSPVCPGRREHDIYPNGEGDVPVSDVVVAHPVLVESALRLARIPRTFRDDSGSVYAARSCLTGLPVCSVRVVSSSAVIRVGIYR